jgi:hypothetical protein
LPVRVQINETGGDDETARIDCVAAEYGGRGDDGDSSALEPDVADCIESGGRVDDASTENDAVVCRRDGLE